MAHHNLKIEAQCRTCGGTGIYVGLAERGGAGVVCNKCKGSGQEVIELEYHDFDGRKPRLDISWVIEVNPGISVEDETLLTTGHFGGMSYDDWLQNKPFLPGTEMRLQTCPAWWFQSSPSAKKPRWPECGTGRSFYNCHSFGRKAQCWDKWDAQQAVLREINCPKEG